jgi:translation elongation factor EF-Tu-like GTPase
VFRIVVHDVFSISGSGTVFTGRVEGGPIAIGDPVLVLTPSREVRRSVDGLESMRKLLPTAEVGQEVGVLCRRIPPEALADCYVGEGENRRPTGIVLVSAPKRWWEFWRE